MDWSKQIPAEWGAWAFTVLLLLVEIGWLLREIRWLRLELKEERKEREVLESSHSKALLASATKTVQALTMLAKALGDGSRR